MSRTRTFRHIEKELVAAKIRVLELKMELHQRRRIRTEFFEDHPDGIVTPILLTPKALDLLTQLVESEDYPSCIDFEVGDVTEDLQTLESLKELALSETGLDVLTVRDGCLFRLIPESSILAGKYTLRAA